MSAHRPSLLCVWGDKFMVINIFDPFMITTIFAFFDYSTLGTIKRFDCMMNAPLGPSVGNPRAVHIDGSLVRDGDHYKVHLQPHSLENRKSVSAPSLS